MEYKWTVNKVQVGQDNLVVKVDLTAIVSGGAKTVDIDSGDSATFFGGSLVMPTKTSGAPWF